MRTTLILALIGASLLITGCQEKGAAEKAGERTDEIIDNVKEGRPLLHEAGTMEKAGRVLEDAVDSEEGK